MQLGEVQDVSWRLIGLGQAVGLHGRILVLCVIHENRMICRFSHGELRVSLLLVLELMRRDILEVSHLDNGR